MGVLQDALRWLAMQPAVHWLAPWAPVSLHNWQGTAISQSATAAPDAPVALADDHGAHPVWAAGLTGQGQIIGAGDSGIGEQSLRSGAASWVRASTASMYGGSTYTSVVEMLVLFSPCTEVPSTSFAWCCRQEELLLR